MLMIEPFGLAWSAGGVDDHPHPLLGEMTGDAFADARRGAGHQRHRRGHRGLRDATEDPASAATTGASAIRGHPWVECHRRQLSIGAR
jgi:hypothetical protein